MLKVEGLSVVLLAKVSFSWKDKNLDYVWMSIAGRIHKHLLS